MVHCFWNVMAHAKKPHFFFRRNERVHLNRRGRQFSRLLAAEVWASAVVMLDTPRSEVVWRVLATHSIRQFTLHFPSPASPCAITFQLDSTIRQSRGDKWQYNTTHALCMLHDYCYTYTLTICNTFPLRQWFRKSDSMLLYTYIPCLFSFIAEPRTAERVLSSVAV